MEEEGEDSQMEKRVLIAKCFVTLSPGKDENICSIW